MEDRREDAEVTPLLDDKGKEAAPLHHRFLRASDGSSASRTRILWAGLLMLLPSALLIFFGAWSPFSGSTGSSESSSGAAFGISLLRSDYPALSSASYPWDHIVEPFVATTLSVSGTLTDAQRGDDDCTWIIETPAGTEVTVKGCSSFTHTFSTVSGLHTVRLTVGVETVATTAMCKYGAHAGDSPLSPLSKALRIFAG